MFQTTKDIEVKMKIFLRNYKSKPKNKLQNYVSKLLCKVKSKKIRKYKIYKRQAK